MVSFKPSAVGLLALVACATSVIAEKVSMEIVETPNHHHHNPNENILETRSCYNYGDSIEIRYVIPNPSEDDWIAIIPSYIVDPASEDYVANTWLSTCDSQKKFCALNHGFVTFGGIEQQDPPLQDVEPGTYKAYLLRGDDSPVYAVSTSFEIPPKNVPCAGGTAITPQTTENGRPLHNSGGCYSRVTTDFHSYTVGEDIPITFTNCNPQKEDWIGVYEVSEDDNFDEINFNTLINKNDPLLWMRTCGAQDCHGKVYSRTLNFGSYNVLQPNKKYRAVLGTKRIHGGPMMHTAKAASASFEIIPGSAEVTARGDECTERIIMSSTCYGEGDKIEFTYTNCRVEHPNTKQDDWIGIYNIETNLSEEEWDYPNVFQWSDCASGTTCSGGIDQDTPSNYFESQANSSWPLPPGEYRAVMVHEANGYYGMAGSVETTFIVKPVGETCFETQRRTRRNLRKVA